MSAHLLKELSDTAHPYYAVFPIPYEARQDGDVRIRTKDQLMRIMRTIDANDYKLLESYTAFEVRLKHAVDEVHFRVAYNATPDMPLRTSFNLPEKKRKHISEVAKLSKRFKQAVANAHQDDSVKVKMDAKERVVVVTADNVQNYFAFWRAVPDSARRTLSNP